MRRHAPHGPLLAATARTRPKRLHPHPTCLGPANGPGWPAPGQRGCPQRRLHRGNPRGPSARRQPRLHRASSTLPVGSFSFTREAREGEQQSPETCWELQGGRVEPEGRGDGTGQQAEGGCGMCVGGGKWDVTCMLYRGAAGEGVEVRAERRLEIVQECTKKACPRRRECQSRRPAAESLT